MYNAGSSAQCSVLTEIGEEMEWFGGRAKREVIYI